MKRTGSDALFVGAYTGQGATEEQFVQTMATADKRPPPLGTGSENQARKRA